jgi:cell wall-associated NlpC family hydrolase
VAWCFKEAGTQIPGHVNPSKTKANPLASVNFMERVFREHDWLVREPKPGDIIFFKGRGQSDRGPGRHVGIVVGVDSDKIEVVDGNWGDAVSHRKIKKGDPNIASFGRLHA